MSSDAADTPSKRTRSKTADDQEKDESPMKKKTRYPRTVKNKTTKKGNIEKICKTYKEFTDQLTSLITSGEGTDSDKEYILCRECLNKDAVCDCLTCGASLCKECKDKIHNFSVAKNHIFARVGTLE